jgi:hypothetical protein
VSLNEYGTSWTYLFRGSSSNDLLASPFHQRCGKHNMMQSQCLHYIQATVTKGFVPIAMSTEMIVHISVKL